MVTICQSPNLLRYLLIFKDHILVLDYSRCTDFRRKILTFQPIHTYVCIRNISYNSFFGWEKWWISSYVFMNKRCPLYYLLCYHIAHRSWYFGNGGNLGELDKFTSNSCNGVQVCQAYEHHKFSKKYTTLEVWCQIKAIVPTFKKCPNFIRTKGRNLDNLM